MGIPNKIDGHVHFTHPMKAEQLIRLMDRTGTERANLVLVPSRQRLTCVPEALMAKAQYPDRFYVFTSLDVSEYFRHRKDFGKYMARFVSSMRRMGCDGLKLIEGKPNMRKMFPTPDFDQPVWEPLWDYAEKTALPILWHVNDPETCWQPDKAPRHIRMAGELYDGTYVNNEDQYRQIEAVLQRHPNIHIVFAHFYFMTAQLPRLAALLDKYPGMMVDITPGLEVYVNFSKDPETASAFFEKYQDRILYGTDIGSRCVLSYAHTAPEEAESLARVDLIEKQFDPRTHRLMEEDGAYLINTEPFTQRGLTLSPEAMEKIFRTNFLKLVGEPAPLRPRLIRKECRRIRMMLKIMRMIDKSMTPDDSVAKNALAFFNKRKNFGGSI